MKIVFTSSEIDLCIISAETLSQTIILQPLRIKFVKEGISLKVSDAIAQLV
jgi:hypothetical protein